MADKKLTIHDDRDAEETGSIISLGSIRSLSKRLDRNHPFRRSSHKTDKLVASSSRVTPRPKNMPVVQQRPPAPPPPPPTGPKCYSHIMCRGPSNRRCIGDQYCEEVTFEYLRNVANAEVIVNYTANGYVSQTKRDHIVENIAIWGEDIEARPETTHLAIRIFDHYMSAKFARDGDKNTPIEQRHPNFAASIGLVAFWLASKFMERYPAGLDDLIKYSNDQLQPEVLRKAERRVFQVLNWNINFPTVYDFTRHYAQLAFGDEEHFMMKLTAVRYLSEFALFDATFIDVSQPLIVAGALFLFIILSSRGLRIGTKSKWTTDIASKTGYAATHLKDVARVKLYPILYNLTKQTQEQKQNHYVFDKYAADEFFGVSKIIDDFIVNYVK